MGLLDALVSWSLRNRAMVLLMTFVLVGLGIRAALRLPIDAVPDVTNVQVQVITTAPALSPLEIEKYVSIPIERAMSGIPHVTETRSLSKYGFSLVTVVFEDDVDIWFARQLVGERMSEAREAVGGEFGVPELGPVSSALGEIYQFTVRNDALDAMQIEEMLDWEIAPQLRSVPGVVELNTQGGFDRQYSVTLDPIEMQALGLTIAEVVDAIERSNANAGGGYLEHAGEQIVIGTSGLIGSLEDLERVVLGATPQGAPITVGMVGEVGFGAALRHGAVSMNGEGEVVIGVVMMTIGANARVVTAAVERKLAELQASMPEGTRIEPFYDRAELVERTIATVAKNLGEGALLVILVLLLLLGDLRAGLVVALTIPLSMAFAVICMDLLGMSGNLMSLGAIDFGLIVDGAVIVVENVARRLAEARAQGGRVDATTRNEIVRTATLEVRRATVFGEAVVAIVYVPILALRGLEGKMFQPMAMVVLLALAGAFVLSLSVVPVLASLLLRPRAGHDTLLLRIIARGYRPVLALALRQRVVVVVLAVAALVSGGVLARRLGAEFVPTLDEGDLLIEARNLPAVGLEQSLAIQQRLQRALGGIPEVGHVVSKIGAPEIPSDGMGLNQTDVFISLAARDQWREGLTKEALGDEIAQVVEAAVPDTGAALSQPIQMRQNEVLAGIRSDIGIIVYGPEFAELQRIAGEVGKAVADIPGVDGLQIEQLDGLNYLRIVPDRRALARHELRIADINLLAESLAVGASAGIVLESDRRFEIRVKTRHAFAGDLESIIALPLRTPSGRVVALGDVAAVSVGEGPSTVNRDAQSRRLIVQMNARGRDLVSVVEDCQAAVAGIVRPDGYRIEFGGMFGHWLEARDRLAVLIPVVLAAIFILLWMAFGELSPALVIASGVPFATFGGVVALWLRDIPFSISAGIGFIALFGVAVLNGLVLVSVARHFEQAGHTRLDAVTAACEQRLRPVLTTALVAALGFVPMAISSAPGSEVQRPLATVVIGGVISATLLTLLVMPVLYSLRRRTQARKDVTVPA